VKAHPTLNNQYGIGIDEKQEKREKIDTQVPNTGRLLEKARAP
jgi:hypothetical protein